MSKKQKKGNRDAVLRRLRGSASGRGKFLTAITGGQARAVLPSSEPSLLRLAVPGDPFRSHSHG